LTSTFDNGFRYTQLVDKHNSTFLFIDPHFVATQPNKISSLSVNSCRQILD